MANLQRPATFMDVDYWQKPPTGKLDVPDEFTRAERQSSRIIRVPGLNPSLMTLYGTNTYLIGTGDRRILLDTGEVNKSSVFVPLLMTALQQNNCQISIILISHGHHDHYGGLPAVLRAFEQAEYEKPLIQKIHSSKLPIPDPAEGYKYTFIKDGDTIKVDGATLIAHYTPGHCDDHTCFFMSEEKALFTGDCILGDTDTTIQDMLDYMKSVETLISLTPNVVYPAHGNTIMRPMAKLEGTLRVKQGECSRILTLLQDVHPKALSCNEITQKIFHFDDIGDMTKASRYVSQHLVRLCRLTRITKKTEKGVDRYLYMF